jgi:hypothetical protein
MARETIGQALSSKSFAVGLSTIIGLTGIVGQMGLHVESLTSGGTLEIGGASLTWGQGFFLSSNVAQVRYFPVAGTVWFAATGATCVVNVSRVIAETDQAG